MAILLVLLLHVNDRFGGPFPDGSISKVFAFACGMGWVGVDLFFVLSGFLITSILLQTKISSHYFSNFYARRLLRIFPVYYGFIALSVWILPVLFPFRGLDVHRGDVWPYALYVANLRQDWSLRGPTFGVFWSLCVEEHFYLFWPMVVYACSPRDLKRVCVGLIAFSFIARNVALAMGIDPWLAYRATPFRMEGLAIGALIAIARTDRRLWASARRWAGVASVGGGAFAAGIAVGQRQFLPIVFAPNDATTTVGLGITAISVCFGGLLVLLLAASPESPMRRLLETAILRSIGKYSYAMYVWHSVVIILSAPAIERLFASLPLPDFLEKLLTFVNVTVITYAVGWLSYHLYERRFLSLKPWFEDHSMDRPASTARVGEMASSLVWRAD